MKSASTANRTKAAPSRSTPPPETYPSFVIQRWSVKLLMVALSLVLQVVIFPPTDWWPLAYVCFVPWLVMIGAAERSRRVYLVSYILGICFFGISMRWLYLVTIPGALVLFLSMALYFPLVACPIRHIVRRRRWPLAVLFPPIWVGCEALRSMVVPRFPWSLLGHSQHTVLTMIQVSDLAGAYGVSFVVAAVNGLVADAILTHYRRPKGKNQPSHPLRLVVGAVFATVVVVATIVYGQVQLHRDTTSTGPRVAILQGNYPNYVDPERSRDQPGLYERRERYLELIEQAASYHPDMLVLPETAWPMVLNREAIEAESNSWTAWSAKCRLLLVNVARQYQAYVVTGGLAVKPTPLDVLASERKYNSAFVFNPDGHEQGRYDKIHLVFIGEYAPFRYGPLRFVYLWLNTMYPLTSEDDEYSLTAGSSYTTFEMHSRSQDGKVYHFATPICYENVMPYVSRRFVTGPDGGKRCDFLLNLSNDGWFAHSTEQPQHLAASVFRAVENRVGVARAVNTGISCFIDPDGRMHDIVEKNGVVVGPGVDGFRVANVKVDNRHTIYSRYGDVFAIVCAGLWGLFYLDYVRTRVTE